MKYVAGLKMTEPNMKNEAEANEHTERGSMMPVSWPTRLLVHLGLNVQTKAWNKRAPGAWLTFVADKAAEAAAAVGRSSSTRIVDGRIEPNQQTEWMQ